MKTPRLAVHEVQLFERPVHFRIPFRFGANTVYQAPQGFVRARIRLEDGREAWGATAELMVPKWFDKNPALSNEDNFEQLRQSLQRATKVYTGDNSPKTAYALSAAHYNELVTNPDSGLNALSAAFGPAQLDKAIMDALCRVLGVSFPAAIKANLPGINAEPLAPDLEDFGIDEMLRGQSLPGRIDARHTIGLADPLTAEERTDGPIDDGLPETLEEVITHYGSRYFKIKIGGVLDDDLSRLKAIARLLDSLCPDYRVTLDGNERYSDVEGILALWQVLAGDALLARLCERVLYVEQPIERGVAFEQSVHALAAKIPVIIDESDGTMDTFPQARELGYAGVSSKACKGFYKSFLNAARCHVWNRDEGGPRYILSGEDLTCQAGLAVQQDLALVGILGLQHVERNGHHYVNGMAGADRAEQTAFLDEHAGLYTPVDGRTCLDIKLGKIRLDTLNCIGFAAATEPDWESMRALSLEN